MSESISVKKEKRKRQHSEQSRSRKRVVLETDSKITINANSEDQFSPVIASVSGFDLGPSTTFNPYLKRRRNASTEKSEINTKELLLHSSDHLKLDYIGKEEEIGGRDAVMKHYIGVYDPLTGNLELIEARNMVIRCSIREQQYDQQDEETIQDLREQKTILGQTFGTKKTQKAIASIKENAISPNLSMREVNESTVLTPATTVMLSSVAMATKEMTSRADLAKAVDESKPRPQANQDASNIESIYTIENLIGTDLFKIVPVKEWQEKVKAKEEVFVRSKYVANRIQSNADKVDKLKILRYMLMLLDLYQSCSKSREGRILPRRDNLKEVIGNIPDAVLSAAKRKFSENGRINKYHVDLIITHLCAMSLLVDNYQTDTCDLKEDLQLDLSQITRYFYEIGVKSYPLGRSDAARYGKALASQRRIARLKLPLIFPTFSFGGKKK